MRLSNERPSSSNILTYQFRITAIGGMCRVHEAILGQCDRLVVQTIWVVWHPLFIKQAGNTMWVEVVQSRPKGRVDGPRPECRYLAAEARRRGKLRHSGEPLPEEK